MPIIDSGLLEFKRSLDIFVLGQSLSTFTRRRSEQRIKIFYDSRGAPCIYLCAAAYISDYNLDI